MSKSEKRYFRLQSRLQAGEKTYCSLFRLLEESETGEDIAELFAAENPDANFEVATKYLRQVILDCLVQLSSKHDTQAWIFDCLTRAGLLFDRQLVDEAFTELRKARKLAEFYEHDALLILIRRTELRYMSATDLYGITEKRLVDKQMKINEVFKYMRSANQHVQLYDVMKYRLTHQGVARSERHIQHLNDLVLSELYLISNTTSYKGFETEKLHLLFQATYSLHSGNYKTALRFYRELIDMFDNNKHRILNPPIHYFNALKGILDSLLLSGLHDEMPYFIERVRRLEDENYTQEFLLGVHASAYLFEFYYSINRGDLTEVEQLRQRYDETLFKKIPLLDLQYQMKLHLSMAIFALMSDNLKEARKWMRKIIGAGKALFHFPDYRVARLVNLLIQMESENHEYLESQINSLKRTISAEKNANQYRTEKLLFRFLKYCPLPSDPQSRAKIWQRLHGEVLAIRGDKYEWPLLKIFDFTVWIEHKLTRTHSIPR
jgi:hypothetical protein